MKKNILIILFLLVGGTTVLLTSCSKDDDHSPVVSLNGSDNIELVLNSSAWDDLGATANDEEDGALTVTSDASADNPDVDHAGTYTVTYTATDKDGNVGVVTRTIVVYNQAKIFAGTYTDCNDTCILTPPTHFQHPVTVTVSDSVNNLVSINNFGAFGTSVTVWAQFNGITANSTINVATGQSLGGSALVTAAYPADSKIISANPSSTSFKIKYQWTDGTDDDVCVTTYER